MWPGGEFSFQFGRRRHGRGFGSMFERGDLKFVILDLLAEKPRHGYEIIRELEERFGGFYAPSPGAVYPTLQMLEDLGYVEATTVDGRKIYRLTEAGRQFHAERKPTVDDIWSRVEEWMGPGTWEGLGQMFGELGEFARLFSRTNAQTWRDPAKQRQIHEVLRRARQEIAAILERPSTPL
ncbi:MAG: PadR family transcriptional regulator [Chloroflexi bacterium]|nr:PadR family transcriptional regulator [Chloroflexota bacterium]